MKTNQKYDWRNPQISFLVPLTWAILFLGWEIPELGPGMPVFFDL
ncbi:MAG: hypothetical protein AAGA85_09960 [Bacteroidota bacterium]